MTASKNKASMRQHKDALRAAYSLLCLHQQRWLVHPASCAVAAFLRQAVGVAYTIFLTLKLLSDLLHHATKQ